MRILAHMVNGYSFSFPQFDEILQSSTKEYGGFNEPFPSLSIDNDELIHDETLSPINITFPYLLNWGI